jgi:hypothetical protein
MNASLRLRAWSPLLLALALAPLASCSGGGGDEASTARDREKARATWVLAIEDAGATHTMTLERMNIYLSEDETESEIFEIVGDGAVLVGEIPAEFAVGYGEAFEKLVGRAVAIAPSGGDPREPKNSSVTIGGLGMPVSGGSLTVERVTGRWSGSEGDKTLHGTIELRVPAADGDRTVRGRFAVNAVTWG